MGIEWATVALYIRYESKVSWPNINRALLTCPLRHEYYVFIGCILVFSAACDCNSSVSFSFLFFARVAFLGDEERPLFGLFVIVGFVRRIAEDFYRVLFRTGGGALTLCCAGLIGAFEVFFGADVFWFLLFE